MKVNVTKDRVSIVESDDIHAGEYNINNLQFSFSDEYSDNLVKNAIFTNDNGNSYQVSIINNKCQLPAEILAEKGSILFGVYAYQSNEEKLELRYSPFPTRFTIISGSYDSTAEEGQEITPSQFEQYMQALNDGLNKVEESIKEMDSATSSVTQLVDDINQKLENGDFIGPEGPQGPQGVPGKNGKDGVGITTITSGQSTVEEDKTITPITVNKTDGSSQRFNVEAKNGADGKDGLNGKDGVNGQNGQDGITPNIQIGTVTTLEPNEHATVTRTGTAEQPVFNFGIPKGEKGNPGEVTEETLDKLIPKDTASGEVVSVDDAIAYKTFNVTVDGASEQHTTTGKNLLPYPYINDTKTENGITFTDNGDGTITVNGEASTNTYFNLINKDFGSNGFGSHNFPSDTYIASTGLDDAYIRLNYDGNNKYVFLLAIPGKTYNNTIIYPMIRLNSVNDDSYEPYTGGQPSPSPDYPQEITTLSFNKITRCGKNLYNVTDIATYYINAVGEDVSVDEEGWITIDVDNSQSSSEKFNNYWTKFSNSLKPNTKYNIFLEIKEVSGTSGYISVTNQTYNSQFNNAFALNLKDISGNSIKNQICITKQNHMEENMTMLRTFLYTPANSKNKITFRISVIEDVTVTPQNFVYEPYQATEYAIDLQGNEFVEISKSIKDNLVIDKYGNVSLIKNVNKKILNGSEDWIYDNQEGDIIQWKVYLGDSTYSNDNEIRCMSDYFIGFGFNDSWYTNNTICLVGGKSMRINTNRFQTVEELKVWLQEHNVTVYYQLATPQTIPLGKLTDIITTLNGTNNIFINGNIPTTISATYALDIKKYIDNKLAEISTAMIEEG